MTKGKRTLSLAMSLIALCGTLSACSEDYHYPEADWKDGSIALIGGKEYTFDEIYKLFETDSKDSARAYYTTAKSVVAQFVTPITTDIESKVDTKITKLHDTWKSNARSNGTSRKTEKEKTFDSEDVEDETELRKKYVAELLIEENSKDFYTENDDDATNNKYYISKETAQTYVDKQAPYHVSHILVKVDASSSGEGYWNGQISADNAKKISNVIRMLSSSDSFGSVAQIASDDSADNYGELYVSGSQTAMEKTTSYINEFKLGVYSYDAFMNPDTKGKQEVLSSLRVPGQKSSYTYADSNISYDYKDDTAVADSASSVLSHNDQAVGIPLSQALKMNYVSEITSDIETGASIDFAGTSQLPRNILFNNYFNYRGVNFVYDDSDQYDADFLADAKLVAETRGVASNSWKLDGTKLSDATKLSMEANIPEKYEEYTYVSNQLSLIDKDKYYPLTSSTGVVDNVELFKYEYNETEEKMEMVSLGKDKNILHTDSLANHGKPIITVRGGTSGDSGYQGIHFIVINEDPFVNEYGKESYNYWRVNVPKTTADAGTANTTDYESNPSFINFVTPDTTSNTTYNNRRDTVESVIKASDSNLDFKLFESNVEEFNDQYKDSGKTFEDVVGEEAWDLIRKYITKTRTSSTESNEDSLDSSWENYVQVVNLQQDLTPRGVIPSVCVSYYEGGSLDGKESLCHVSK